MRLRVLCCASSLRFASRSRSRRSVLHTILASSPAPGNFPRCTQDTSIIALTQTAASAAAAVKAVAALAPGTPASSGSGNGGGGGGGSSPDSVQVQVPSAPTPTPTASGSVPRAIGTTSTAAGAGANGGDVATTKCTSTPSASGGGGGNGLALGVSGAGGIKKSKGGRKAANPAMSDEERRQERVLKNRVSAMKSLQKKKRYTDDLERRAKALTAQNHELKTRIYALLAKLAQNGVPIGYALAPYPYDALLQSLLAEHNPYAAMYAHQHPHQHAAAAAALVRHQHQHQHHEQQHLISEQHRAALAAAAHRQAMHTGQVAHAQLAQVQAQAQARAQAQAQVQAQHMGIPPPAPASTPIPAPTAAVTGMTTPIRDNTCSGGGVQTPSGVEVSPSTVIKREEDIAVVETGPVPLHASAPVIDMTHDDGMLSDVMGDALDDIGVSFLNGLNGVDAPELTLLTDVHFDPATPTDPPQL